MISGRTINWSRKMKKRSMKRCKGNLLIFLLAISIPYTYGGCVVVYSSGNVNRAPARVDNENQDRFSGRTLEAAITPLNANDLAAGAFIGGLTGKEPKRFKLTRRSNSAPKEVFRPLRIPHMLVNSLRLVQLDPAKLNFSQTYVIVENNILAGTCGGDLSYTLDLNKKSQNFSGNLLFTSYCDNQITVSGDTDVDGTFEVGSAEFKTATFSFDNLSDGSNALDGEISIDFSDTPILATFSAHNKNEHNGHVYWIREYSINLSEFIGHLEIEIFGTFYDPDDGFVTLATSKPFVVFDEDAWPAAGQLLINGDDYTDAQLIVIDQLHYRITADTKGDGIFDWESGILSWTAR